MTMQLRFALGLLLVLAACGDSGSETVFVPGDKVLVIGDSLVAGFGVKPDKTFAAVFDEQVPADVVARGRNGETSAGLLRRLPAEVRSAGYRWVIVVTGGNDMLRGESESALEKNLGSIVEIIQNAGATPVLVAIPRPRSRSDLPVYRQVADDYEVRVLEGVSGKLSRTHFLIDGIHPNASGHAIIAEELQRFFAK